MKIHFSLLVFLCFTLTILSQEVATKGITDIVKNHIKERVDKGINQSIVVGLINGGEVE